MKDQRHPHLREGNVQREKQWISVLRTTIEERLQFLDFTSCSTQSIDANDVQSSFLYVLATFFHHLWQLHVISDHLLGQGYAKCGSTDRLLRW